MAVPAANNSYQVIQQFIGSDNVAATTPYLLPPAYNISKDQTLRISNVNGKNAVVGNASCNITMGSGQSTVDNPINTDFSLTWVAGPGAAPSPTAPQPASFNESPLVAQITIKADNIWKAAANA